MASNAPCVACGQRVSLSDSSLCSVCETPPLPGMDVSGTVGHEDDWFETPWPLAQVCVAQAMAVYESQREPILTVPRVICPAVGRGVFPLAVRWYLDEVMGVNPNTIVGCDTVDRSPKGLDLFTVVGDARTMVPGPGPWDLAIDNIPFDAEVAIPIVQRFVEIAKYCAFILPWSPLGGVDQWAPIMASGACRPVWAWPIAPRPWGEHTRETALYLWRRGEQPHYTKVDPLPRWRP